MITLAMAQAWWTAAALFHQPYMTPTQLTGPAYCLHCDTAWPCIAGASLAVKLSAARHRVRSHRQPTSPLFKAFALMGLVAMAAGLVVLLMLWNTSGLQTDTPIPLPAPSAQTGPNQP